MRHVSPSDMPVPKELQVEAANRFNRFADLGYIANPFLCMCKLIAGKKLKRHYCEWEFTRSLFLDHLRGYRTREGERVVISQPYANSDAYEKVVGEAQQFADKHGLSIRVSRDESWHFPGWTILIEFRKKTQANEEAA
jgi:hypothetical protein